MSTYYHDLFWYVLFYKLPLDIFWIRNYSLNSYIRLPSSTRASIADTIITDLPLTTISDRAEQNLLWRKGFFNIEFLNQVRLVMMRQKPLFHKGTNVLFHFSAGRSVRPHTRAVTSRTRPLVTHLESRLARLPRMTMREFHDHAACVPPPPPLTCPCRS